uniref:Uncharacterized protein n=1 Tax=viral metagenome TaxID=1070528 RepID=A0A6C0JWB6_9ZZZZ
MDDDIVNSYIDYEIVNSDIDYEFDKACIEGDINKMTELVERVNSYHKHRGLYYACGQGHVEIIRLLLPHVDQVGIESLNIACHMPFKPVDCYVAIIKLLLEHTKFDTTNTLFTTRDLPVPAEIRNLLDQHMFALDSLEYNKNILT